MSKYRITIEGKTYEMDVEFVGENQTPKPGVKRGYKEYKNSADPFVSVINPSAQKHTVARNGAVKAPMPGTVLKIEKGEGELVKMGDLILILEAMKMENEIVAPIDGRIISMNCEEGSTVVSGDLLFEVK